MKQTNQATRYEFGIVTKTGGTIWTDPHVDFATETEAVAAAKEALVKQTSYFGDNVTGYAIRAVEVPVSMITAVEIAKRRLEITRLRNLADWQRGDYAISHRHQAEHPMYPGQEIVCERKAAQADRLAAKNEAKADLMEAELAE